MTQRFRWRHDSPTISRLESQMYELKRPPWPGTFLAKKRRENEMFLELMNIRIKVFHVSELKHVHMYCKVTFLIYFLAIKARPPTPSQYFIRKRNQNFWHVSHRLCGGKNELVCCYQFEKVQHTVHRVLAKWSLVSLSCSATWKKQH